MASDYKSFLKSLEDLLDEYLVKKAPALPKGVKDAIVNFAPWIILIGIVLGLPFILAALGLNFLLFPAVSGYAGVYGGVGYILTVALNAIALVLEVMALPGLFKRQKRSWYLVYYAVLVGLLASLVRFDIGGFIVGGLIGLYILFQVKSYYS